MCRTNHGVERKALSRERWFKCALKGFEMPFLGLDSTGGKGLIDAFCEIDTFCEIDAFCEIDMPHPARSLG